MLRPDKSCRRCRARSTRHDVSCPYGRRVGSLLVEAGVDLADDFFDWLVDIGKERLGIDANPESEEDERQKHGIFTEIQVRERFVRVVSDGPEHHTLIEPEEISGAKNDAESTPGSPGFVDHEGALKNGEFSNEAVENRHSERAERDDQVDRGVIGHGRSQATKFGDEACVAAFVEYSDD